MADVRPSPPTAGAVLPVFAESAEETGPAEEETALAVERADDATNESPRERGRVLQKRNPIASEYQVPGFLGRAPGADADGEGADYRAFFAATRLAFNGRSSIQWEAFQQYQGYRGRFMPGASLRALIPLYHSRPLVLEFRLAQTEADRLIEHYEAAWASRPLGDGREAWILERPRISEDHFQTRVRDGRFHLEFRPSAPHLLYAQAVLVEYADEFFRNRTELNFRSAPGGGLVEATKGSDPTYTTAATDAGTARRYFGHTLTDRTTRRILFGGEYAEGAVGVDYSLYFSKWRNSSLGNQWNFIDRGLDLAYRIDRTHFPELVLDPPERLHALEESLFNDYRIQVTETVDRDLGGRIDASFDLNGAGRWQFFGGALYREKERRNQHDRDVFGPRAERPLTLAEVAMELEPGLVVRQNYQLARGIDAAMASALLYEADSPYLRNAAQSTIESAEQRYRSFEAVVGTYGFLRFREGPWDAELGLRRENTRTRTRGTIVAPPEFAPPEAGPILGELEAPGGTRVIQERRASNHYEDWLPTVALAFRPGGSWQLRAAAYESLMRPQYFDIVEYRRIFLPTRTISEGNPGLLPTFLRTYSVALERDLERWGNGSVEIYQIDVEDFFYGAQRFETVQGEEFSVSRVENGESGRIRGFQLQWQTDLPRLPMGLRPSLATAYTFSSSEASVATRSGERFTLPERSRHLVRASLRVRQGSFNASLNLGYQSVALDQLGESAGRDAYRSEVIDLGAAANYRFGPFGVFASMANLPDYPERAYAGDPLRSTKNQYGSYVLRLGLNGQF